MEQLTIQNVDSTIKFELCKEAEWDGGYGNCIARIKYEFYGRTIYSEHIWGLNVWLLQQFADEMKSMYSTFKGEARLSSNDGDSLELKMSDEYGHIYVDFKDGMDGYNGYVQINFSIDQSYLPELIEQAEAMCLKK